MRGDVLAAEDVSPLWDTVSEEQRACRSKVSGAQFQAFFDAQICSATPPCTYRALLICQLVAVHGTRSYKLSPFLWWEQPHTPLFRPSSPLPHCVHQIVSSSPSFCALASHYLWQNQPKLIARVSRSGWDWHLLRASCVSRFLVLFQINFELLGDESASIIYPHDIRIPHLSFYHVLSFICSHLFSTFHSAVAGGAGGCWGHHRALQSGSTERCPGKEGKELPYD